MACKFLNLPDGGTAIICGLRRSKKRCVTCGAQSEFLCDFPVKGGQDGMCSRPVCHRHLEKQSDGRDFCLAHAKFAKEHPEACQLKL
jgi:hypothetical protein